MPLEGVDEFNRESARWSARVLPGQVVKLTRYMLLALHAGVTLKTPVGNPDEWERVKAGGGRLADRRSRLSTYSACSGHGPRSATSSAPKVRTSSTSARDPVESRLGSRPASGRLLDRQLRPFRTSRYSKFPPKWSTRRFDAIGA